MPPTEVPNTATAVTTSNANALAEALSPMRMTTLAERCYEQLKEAIIGLDLPPGTPLSETQVAAQFGVSKSPVREALQRLDRDGLVVAEPGRRSRVTGIDRADIREWYEMRLMLEPASLRRIGRQIEQTTLERIRTVHEAAIRACASEDTLGFVRNSDLFHLGLIEQNGNRTLVTVLRDLFDRIRRVRVAMYRCQSPGGPHEIVQAGMRRHAGILAALEAHDIEIAAQRLQEDIQAFLDDLDRGVLDAAIALVSYPR